MGVVTVSLFLVTRMKQSQLSYPNPGLFRVPRTSENGLDSAEVERRRGIFGPNRLEEKSVNPFLQFLSFMWK